ncbi:MAG: helix-turn-helix domain-containing protein [Oscillospiraceae bacterium]
MIDYLWEARQALIENFQISMKAIRLLMGYSIVELAEYVGVTRQTINNLETGKSKMSAMQFLSLAAVVDNYIAINGDMYQAIAAILDGNGKKTVNRYDTSFSGFSLLRRWFLLFEGTGAEIMANDGESLDAAQVQQMVRGYKIFLDDTVLLSEKAEEFLCFWENYLIAENGKLIIPLRAIECVQERTQDAAYSQQAVKALRTLNWMQQKNLIQIRGEESDANLRDTILSVFLKFRGTYRLCLITQDKKFAAEVLRLNETSDRGGFNIVVGYINGDGKLVMYGSESPSSSKSATSDTWSEIASHEPVELLETGEDNLTSWEYL